MNVDILLLSGVVGKPLQTGVSSMSTSLLYHGLGIRGYRYVKTKYIEDGLAFGIAQEKERCRCSACGSSGVTLRGNATG